MKLCIVLIGWMLSQYGFAAAQGIGIGGGGAMSGISFDPHNQKHMFIGTDMGLVYESFDLGKTWTPISQQKIQFYGDLKYSSHMGIDENSNYYWASGGCDPQISHDHGENYASLASLAELLPKNCLDSTQRISYWFFNPDDKQFIGVGAGDGLFISIDAGKTWQHLLPHQQSLASLVVDGVLYHANQEGIFSIRLIDLQTNQLLKQKLSLATMGHDKKGITLVGVSSESRDAEKTVYIKPAEDEEFNTQTLAVGDFIKMSLNNSSVIYYTGNVKLGQGASVWTSQDVGKTWIKKYTDDQYGYNHGQVNPNPVGLEVGFWDSELIDFQVAPSDPNIIASSGNFFFKRSIDAGETWSFPYSTPVDPAKKVTRSSFWKSTELNPVSVFFSKSSPSDENILIAGLADIGCVVSKDKGGSFRMCNIPNINTIYDADFNPQNPQELYVAASSIHDFPQDWHGDIQNHAPGGIYHSTDLGLTWQKISPNEDAYNNPYLSLAVDFKVKPCQIYAGTQGRGIMFSQDCGNTWKRINDGFESQDSSEDSSQQKGSLIFPKIKISPVNGDVYALHAGNRLWRDAANPYLQYTGLYKLDKATLKWVQLGHTSKTQGSASIPGNLYWKYPLDFAINWQNPKQIYLLDMGTAGTWKITGVWYSDNEGVTWEQVLQFDRPHRVIIKDNKVYIAGWSDPDQPFIYTGSVGGPLQPSSLRLPMQHVDDMLIEDDGFVFGTFGGGLFKTGKDS